jgi:hypothetical protein
MQLISKYLIQKAQAQILFKYGRLQNHLGAIDLSHPENSYSFFLLEFSQSSGSLAKAGLQSLWGLWKSY